MPEQWLADGYDITQGDLRNVEYRSGLYTTPAAVGENRNIPGLTGARWRRKTHGQGGFVLNVWVRGVSQSAAYAAYEELLAATVHTSRLVRFTRVMADNVTSRYADGEVVDSVAPVALGQRAYRMGLAVRIPGAYFFDTNLLTSTTTLTGLTPGPFAQIITLTAFGGATAPMELLTYEVRGGLSNFTLTASTNGVDTSRFTYGTSVAAGNILQLNSATWTIEGSVAPVEAAVTYTHGRFLVLPPARPGQFPRITISGTYASGVPSLTVTGRRAYLA